MEQLMIPIFIPTRGRINTQNTWDAIGPEAREVARLVCPTEEVKHHEWLDRRVLDRGDVKGINNARQFIIDHAVEEGHDKIIILDDDLKFNRRESAEHSRFRKTRQPEMLELWEKMEGLLDGYHHVGLSPRQMNDKHWPHTVQYGMRQNAVHGITPRILHKHNIRYDSMQLMEDYYVTLKLFLKGIGNAVIVDWTWDQRGASGAKGGCSTYRNAELQEQQARKLSEEFPDHVKLVEKTTKTGWEGMKTRWDVKVSWRKAFKDGQARPS